MRRSQLEAVSTAAVAGLGLAAVAAGLPAPALAVPGLALMAAPGYVWSQVLAGSRVTGLERLVITGGLALLVPVIGGVALYLAGLPLHAVAWAGLLAGVTLAGDAVLLARGRGDAAPRPARRPGGARPGAWTIAGIAAAAVIAAGAVGVARTAAQTQRYPGFTELWLAPQRQHAGSASLGVANHQGAAMRYRLVLLRRGHVHARWTITLADGQTWQRTVRFSGRRVVAANLYRLPDLVHPYRRVAVSGDPAARS